MKNYLDNYRNTEMYKKCILPRVDVNDPSVVLKGHTDMDTREEIKQMADIVIAAGFIDLGLMMIDFSHRQRYLNIGKNKLLSFYEYVEYKYTNPELRTY